MTKDKIEMLDKLCKVNPTIDECATMLSMSRNTIMKWIKTNNNCTFSQYKQKKIGDHNG